MFCLIHFYLDNLFTIFRSVFWREVLARYLMEKLARISRDM